MHSISKVFIFIFFALTGSLAQAANKLVINAVEFGVAKFHRYDNKVHAYGTSNAWTAFILPDGADTTKPLIQKNDNGSFTIFYSTLVELVQTATEISEQQQQPISVLNINGHGLPGAMWFPVDTKTMKSKACADWVEAANGDDADNYNQYYSAISKEDIMEMR